MVMNIKKQLFRGTNSFKIKKTYVASFCTALFLPTIALAATGYPETITSNKVISENIDIASNLWRVVKAANSPVDYTYRFGALNVTSGADVLVNSPKIDIDLTAPKTLYSGLTHFGVVAGKSYLTLGSKETITSVNIEGQFAPDQTGDYALLYAISAIAKPEQSEGNTVRKGARVDIYGKELSIRMNLDDRTFGNALFANTNHTHEGAPDEERAVINLYSDAVIDVKGAKAYGMSAYSAGKINVYGNLDLTSEKTALSVRGLGEININPNKDIDKIININGDVSFDFNDVTSGTDVDGAVRINLTNSQSSWTGSVKYAVSSWASDIKNPGVTNKVINKHNLEITLSNGATWNTASVDQHPDDEDKNPHVYFAPVSKLTLDGGVVNVHNEGQPVVVNQVTGNGTINVAASKNDKGEVSTGRLVVGSNSQFNLDEVVIDSTTENGAKDAVLAVNYNGINSDDLEQADFVELSKQSVQASGATQTHTLSEGLINGEWVHTVNENGEVTSMQSSVNTVNQSLRDIGAITFLGFRTTINDLDKRLGDLRSYSGENGGWVRYLGGQNRYGARSMKLNYNGFQAGFDHRFGEFYAGAAFGYTKGNGHLHNGSSDNDNWNFGLYGGWLGEKGQFVDVIVKRHRFKNEFNLHNTSGVLSSGSYHNWATSFSVETGWRLQCPANGFYVEPQAEFMFGRMEDGSFTTNKGVKVKQDSVNTTVGRLGAAVGYTLPENKGNAYVKASVLHDWSAKVKGSMSKDGLKTSYRDDLSGTWAEFSIGGTYNATKNISAYAEVQTSAGSPIRSPWAASVGVRYNF